MTFSKQNWYKFPDIYAIALLKMELIRMTVTLLLSITMAWAFIMIAGLLAYKYHMMRGRD